MLIVFILILVAGGYAIMPLRNINGLVKEATVFLQKNKDHLNQSFPALMKYQGIPQLPQRS
jgi:hypothetical protein